MGIIRELNIGKKKLKCLLQVHVGDTITNDNKKERGITHENEDVQVSWNMEQAWDDITGATLDPVEVTRTHLKDVGYIMLAIMCTSKCVGLMF